MSHPIKISGFTLLRNGVEFDYPFRESLRSLAPLVDELWVNVGISTDSTLDEIQKLAAEPAFQGKLKWFESEWPLNDPAKKKEGIILSEQTNLALDRCTGEWCFYLQADEVLHEQDSPQILAAIQKADPRPEIDGILFDYVHLYGSFDVEQHTRSAYRREVRLIRRKSGCRSVGDAQSFRKGDGSKPCVIRGGGHVFHYGWVRTPEAMKEKTFFMDQLYHGAPSVKDAAARRPHSGDNYRYRRFWGLRRFQNTHPSVMVERISTRNWRWDLESSPLAWSWKDSKKILLDLFEQLTGIRLFEYRSYRLFEE